MSKTKKEVKPVITLKLKLPDVKSDSLPIECYRESKYKNIRNLKIIMFSNALMKTEAYKEKPLRDRQQILIKLERGCYNEAIDTGNENSIICSWDNQIFEFIYNNVCCKITSVLDRDLDSYSEIVINNLLEEKLDIENIAKLPYAELCPEKYAEIQRRINKRANQETKIKSGTSHFCRKCKRNNTIREAVQNCSNDEGSSFYITCLFCNNQWYGR